MMFLRSSGVEGESNMAWGNHLQLSTIIVIPYHQHLDYHYHHPQHTDFLDALASLELVMRVSHGVTNFL